MCDKDDEMVGIKAQKRLLNFLRRKLSIVLLADLNKTNLKDEKYM